MWEGSDGVGKGTTMRMALDESKRRGIPTLAVREPGGTELGRVMRDILLHGESLDPETEQALFTADRSHLARRIIQPALEQGIDVHSDRNYWSGIAYQGAGGLDTELIVKATELFMPEWYVTPDIGIVLQLDTQERLRRKLMAAGGTAGLDRMEKKDQEFFRAVDTLYEQQVVRRFGAHGISALGSPDEVFARVKPLLFKD